MVLSVTNNFDNSETPGVTATAYFPDQLIAGDLKQVTEGQATITGGVDLFRGALLGQVTVGAGGPAVAGANTGNGAISAIVPGSRAKVGNYIVRYTSPTAFNVINPFGVELAPGVNGAYANIELNFTATAGGTAFVAGDSFTIPVASAGGGYKLCAAAAADGSQNPSAILVDTALASGGDVNAGIYIMGEFNIRAMTFGAGMSAAIAKPILQPLGIFLKTSVSAADPT